MSKEAVPTQSKQPFWQCVQSFVQNLVKACMPLPYCEMQGMKFWNKAAFDAYREEQMIEAAKKSGTYHTYHGVAHQSTVIELKSALLNKLDELGGQLIECHIPRDEYSRHEFSLSYICRIRINIKSEDWSA